MDMSAPEKDGMQQRPGRMVPLFDRFLTSASRNKLTISLILAVCSVASMGLYVMRQLQRTNEEAENKFLVSAQGLHRIGELQLDAQETRRATLYALNTNDSRLQIDYAGKSRDAGRRVSAAITEYHQQAKQPKEIELATRLGRDWASYQQVRDDVLALILKEGTAEALQQDLSEGVPAFERVRQDLSEIQELYDAEVSRRVAAVQSASRRSAMRAIGMLVFAFVLSSAGIWFMQRRWMLGATQHAKMQMEFVAFVSHELRTPLAVLSSAADNLTDGVVAGKPELQRYGKVIQNQSREMKRLVDEILLFASTEERKLRYTLQPLQVSQIIEAITTSTRELIEGSEFALEVRVEAGIPPVLGELSAITQCLQNLIANAVKYSVESKWVGLSVVAAPAPEGTGPEVQITVADHGIGIARAEMDSIFVPFYRSPLVRSMQIRGTGLGLALTKRIAETLGGRLTVSSEISVGSAFTLHLPIAEGEKAATARATSARQSTSS